MRKLLALLLTLAMTLSLLSVGFVSTSAEEIPVDAIAIDDVNDFKPVAEGGLMEAGGVYKLTADIYVGTPKTYEETPVVVDDKTVYKSFTIGTPVEGDTKVTVDGVEVYKTKIVPNDVEQDAEEHAIITIPAGVTIYGNGKTIYQNYYTTNPVDYVNSKNQQGAGSKSLPWTHAMFELAAGDMITFNGVNFGSEELPVHLTASGSATVGLFADASADVNCTWNDVDFFFRRADGGLDNRNLGPVMHNLGGNLTFNRCNNNNLYVSSGNQHGGWFYESGNTGNLTMTDCTTNGEILGNIQSGIIHIVDDAVNMTFTRCVNNVSFTSFYDDAAYKYASGGFVGYIKTALSLKFYDCVNNGNITTGSAISSAFVARSSATLTELVVDGCVNNGKVDYTKAAVAANVGFGAFVGHVGAATFTVNDCVNNGDIDGTGNLGGIIGRIDGGTTVNVTNCKNYGKITAAAGKCNEIAGIIGQNNTIATVENCMNFGTVTGSSVRGSGGIMGTNHNSGDAATFTNCRNYGSVYGDTYSGGILGQLVTSTSVTLSNCANFGDLTTGHTVGGMVAQVWGKTVDIDNCLNAGTIGNHANNEGVGGFIGRVAITSAVITIDNSANIGTIKGSTKKDSTYGIFGDTFGQFIGLYTVSATSTASYNGDKRIGGFHDWTADGAVKPTLTNCYAYGTATPAQNAESLTGWITKDAEGKEAKTVNVFTALNNDKLVAAGGENKTFTDDASKPAIEGHTAVKGSADGKTYYKDSNGKIYSHSTTYTNAHIAVTVAPNNGMYGKNVEATLTNCEVLGVNEVTTASAIEKLNTLFGLDFMAGTAEEDKIVVATPALRGYQMSTDGTSIRFLSTISSLNYANVGYTYSATLNGAPVFTNKVATTTNVLQSINAVEGEDDMTTKSATEMGGKYIVALTFINVPAEGTVVITLTPNAGAFDGTTYTITIVDGNVTTVAPAAAN